MEILKTAVDWARAEVFSSTFFILFGLLFLAASIGFWQIGKSDIAKAYITPTLVAGSLILLVGIGIMYANYARQTSFIDAYNHDAATFISNEISRTLKSMGEYQTIVFKVIPAIIAGCALLIIFMDSASWRAASITTIAMMVVILLVDSNANSRLEAYNNELLLAKGQNK